MPCAREARPGTALPPRVSSASIGVTPIQCFWNVFTLPGSSSESAYWLSAPPNHQALSNRLARSRAC